MPFASAIPYPLLSLSFAMCQPSSSYMIVVVPVATLVFAAPKNAPARCKEYCQYSAKGGTRKG